MTPTVTPLGSMVMPQYVVARDETRVDTRVRVETWFIDKQGNKDCIVDYYEDDKAA